jgi:hypothetical protein
MVAMVFVPHVECASLTVNHKDGNTENNASGNLEWCSQSYNSWHKCNVLGIKTTGESNGMSKLSEQDVFKICSYLEEGLSQSVIADIFSVNQGLISMINTGKRWNELTNRKQTIK